MVSSVGVEGNDAQIFTEIGNIAADLFHGADLVGSDIGAALIVMGEQDGERWKRGIVFSRTL